MPKAVECLVKGKIVVVDDAIRDRNAARATRELDPDWRCIECNSPVRHHSAGGTAAGHFEHFERNPNCSLSDPQR